MKVTVLIPAWTEQVTVEDLAHACNLPEDEVRKHLPGFIDVTVREVVMDQLRRDSTEQLEFLAYVHAQRRKAEMKAAASAKAALAPAGMVG